MGTTVYDGVLLEGPTSHLDDTHRTGTRRHVSQTQGVLGGITRLASPGESCHNLPPPTLKSARRGVLSTSSREGPADIDPSRWKVSRLFPLNASVF